MSIDTVERATAKLRLQLQHDRAMSLHKPDVTIKLRIFEETAKALRTTPLLYQTTRTGDCAPQTVPGYGVVSPAANQFRGRVTVCPHTPQEFSDTTSMMTMLIHEMVHQADENNRFPMYYSKDQFFYECRTEKLALEIVYLGTGFRAVQAYRC